MEIVGQQGWRAEIGKGSAQALAIRVATLKAVLIKVAKIGRQIAFVDLRFKQPYTTLK